MNRIDELKLEVIHFETEDVIATSTPTDYNDNLNGDWI